MEQPQFIPTRAAGLERLEDFAANMGAKYAADRNSDFGQEDRSNVSCLSPWLRHRLITEKEVAQTALSRFKYSTAEKFIQEVCWRTYFKGWLEHRPTVWTEYCKARDRWMDELASGSALKQRYDSAISGKTGIDAFDHWAMELIETGYLHNHARMWFASIWMFTLKLPCELGADFFLQHLIDGDPASNTLSWRWVGGLHTKGKTYLARQSNIEKYTGGRFAPEGLAEEAVPVDGFENPPVTPLKGGSDLPEGPFGLLLTEEDLQPETLLPQGVEVASVAGFASPGFRSPNGVGEKARGFAEDAARDGLARAQSKFSTFSVHFQSNDRLEQDLLDWAQDLPSKHVVLPWQPTGWVAARTYDLCQTLRSNGFELSYIRRSWDEDFWPNATKGFFRLKQTIPDVLASEGLPV